MSIDRPSGRIPTDRRTVLKGIGAGIVGATALSTTVTAQAGTGAPGDVASMIDSDGHYAWFPLGPDSWARSTDPVDTQRSTYRWMAMPESDGSVRCLVENLPENRNAGFDVHLGRLGDIEAVTVDAETVRTTRSGGSAVLFVGLYLDADDDGEFFAWTDGGATDAWDSFGDDSEGAAFLPAAGEFTVDDATEFQLFHVGSGPNPATLGEIKDGAVTGVNGETIDAGTDVAVYIGVTSPGEGSGTEEVLVNSIAVERWTAAYTTEAGTLDSAGFRAAVRDWAQGDLSTARLKRMISLYVTGE